jgi:hypothetical protein
MIQQNYGRYIRDDGDALLRAYVAGTVSSAEPSAQNDEDEPETGTFAGTFSSGSVNSVKNMVVPTGIEPVFPT